MLSSCVFSRRLRLRFESMSEAAGLLPPPALALVPPRLRRWRCGALIENLPRLLRAGRNVPCWRCCDMCYRASRDYLSRGGFPAVTNSSNLVVKPPALRPGATLAVLSPASTPKADLVHRGIAHLRSPGIRLPQRAHVLDSGPLYYAGSMEDRLEDLHAAFADPAIDGILCARGGWGSAELLPHLDAALIRSNPKAFIG